MSNQDHITNAHSHFEYDFGSLYCYGNYVISMIKEGATVNSTVIKTILKDLDSHFSEKQYVYIADRATSHNIDLSIYKLINPKKLIGIAIVSSRENEIERAVEEQSVYSGSFGLFKNTESAIAWTNTFQAVSTR